MSGVVSSKLNYISSLPVPIADGGTGAATASAAVDALGGASSTGTGGLVRTTSPTLVTPTLGVAAATSVTLGAGTALSNYDEGTFTPTVGNLGAGTIPEYSINSGRYTRIGRLVHVVVLLYGDGGNEGSGAGQLTITLPFIPSASQTTYVAMAGQYINGSVRAPVFATIDTSNVDIELSYNSAIGVSAPLTAGDQNSTTRAISLSFTYEV